MRVWCTPTPPPPRAGPPGRLLLNSQGAVLTVLMIRLRYLPHCPGVVHLAAKKYFVNLSGSVSC